MTGRKKKSMGAVASLALGAGILLSPAGAGAQTPHWYNPDSAHHSEVNDGDKAHHQPRLVCPTSKGDQDKKDKKDKKCKLVPVRGFDYQGNYIGNGGGNGGGGKPDFPAGYDADPAHHSAIPDGDSAHHQPTLEWVGNEWVLTPIPGFDLSGNPTTSGGKSKK